MFWVNFEWMVFTEPHNYEADGDTIKLNDMTVEFWERFPEEFLAMSIICQVILEN